MAYVNGTTHYNLPQTVGTDKRDWADTNEAFASLDAAVYSAVEDVADAQTEINGLKDRMTTAEGNITTNTNDISALDGRLTTAEGTITQHTTQIADVRQDVEDMICAYNEASATSTHAYAVGDYFIYNDVLYRAIQAIAIGDTIVPDTNCTTTNVASELKNRTSTVLHTVVCDGVHAIGTVLNTLYNYFDNDPDAEYLLKSVDTDNNRTNFIHEVYHGTGDLMLVTVQSAAANYYVVNYRLRANNLSSSGTWDTTASGSSFTDQTNTFIPAEGRTFSLIKLTTSIAG